MKSKALISHGSSVASIFLAMSVIILLSVPNVFAQSTDIFPDVHEGDPHYLAIKYLKEKNLIQGYENGNFKPLQIINRAEALQVLLKAIPPKKAPSITLTGTTQSQQASQEIINFPDVKKEDWFYENVQNAFERKIISGYSDHLFHPERNINRAEALKIVLKEAQTYLPATVETPPYNDVPIDCWFAIFAQVSKERGLFLESRDKGYLLPEVEMTRGQFVELIYRLLRSNEGYKFSRATFYADSLAGRGTASGEAYQPAVFTTAHRTLPMGTRMIVTNLANGKQVEVKVNDRGPYATGIDLDLSKSAFAAIASVGTGVITTQFQILP